ncbi:damage-control phosphatase ARMT1 isoform X2 [Drosophila novamexicana]|uniref:damage-control phosphatase ARMT1 isoform X2 n=1 Tax=Drosophila novamexicana TaxID=47314 RepID=UPI0011E5DDAA|nr:damage-control phosphatase ARMT1 isoform X2 [Drosophila novamexicana]
MEPEGGECAIKDGAADSKIVDQSFVKVFKSEFDAKYNIVDIQTPLNAFMSGQFKRSYAYFTLRNLLPVVLTKVIDSLTKDKGELVAQFGENAREELKIIIGLISRLKYELQTDKPFQKFTGDEVDRESWNSFISHLPNDGRTFYQACWMHTQCYLYRKLYSFVENSIFIKQFDYFGKIKEHALTSCQDDILSLAKYTRRTENSVEMFNEMLKIDLWSNRNDLSENEHARMFNMRVLEDVSVTDGHILANNASEIWDCLSNKKTNKQHVDFVLDNAGYELFTDFILAEYIIEKGLASKVRFHVKACPWFVTNATQRDFHMTLQYLSKHPDYIISLIGNKFLQFMDEGKFELAPVSYFWTGPRAFHYMKTLEPELYRTLQQSKLIIFKGDLNYRKLLSDVCWEPTQDMRTCLGGFIPSSFCTVRTIKAEVICGLSEGVVENLKLRDPNWMLTGNYGTIQYVDGSREFGY